MTEQPASPTPARPSLPDAPALLATAEGALWLSPEGEVEMLAKTELARRLRESMAYLCHGPATARRLAMQPFRALDLLELYAFVRPARSCPPTPRGLAQSLGLAMPEGPEAMAASLILSAERLLAELAAAPERAKREARDIAWGLARGGWPWGPAVLAALGLAEDGEAPRGQANALRIWQRLAQWSEHAPEPPPGHHGVEPAEARKRLAEMLGGGAEPRPQQADYAAAVTEAFRPRQTPGQPNAVLAEAGTGVGKTLGYLAPASLWAEKNGGAVWISTYTRNLQHQIDAELDRHFPEPGEKARKVVIRKGRENYLCLLNLEEAVNGLPNRPQDALAVSLMARWASRTRDGDMVGGDFPGWLPDLVGRGRTLGLADRRGECIYAACPHYSKCFIERQVRRARRAEIVIANHALVMIQSALGGDDGQLSTRLVFDEGHHLFDAADSAFSAHLSGVETRELRRWLLGAEGGGSRSAARLRGLERRLEDLIHDDDEAKALLSAVLRAARGLPGQGWLQRVEEENTVGPTETFLALVRRQVYARAHRQGDTYSIETELLPAIEGLLDTAQRLDQALMRLAEPTKALIQRLLALLDDDAAELDSDQRRRIEAMARSLERRCLIPVNAWRGLLQALSEGTPEAFVDWLSVERIDGRDIDVGAHRHWVDPTEPLAETVYARAHGALITSATLTDGSGDVEQDWAAAETRSGTAHLEQPAWRTQVPSPFDYAANTKVFIVTDLRKDDLDQVAAAYRELFLAAGGGGLGLFTAISRLRRAEEKLRAPLEAAGLALYAQHADRLDVSTLVDIFRAEHDACLLGTDAVRDGVDVPGPALRLIVFDRVPWPRPTIAHKARRERFGGRAYDEMLTRLKLKQAFGRLVRRADDRGVFVMLDRMTPTRLLGAFPEGVAIERVGLAEAVAETRTFLAGERDA